MQRRDSTVAELYSKSKILKKEMEATTYKLSTLEVQVEQINSERQKLGLAANYLKRKIAKMENEPKTWDASIDEGVMELTKQVDQLSEENRFLNSLGSVMHSEEIITWKNGRYTDDVRQTDGTAQQKYFHGRCWAYHSYCFGQSCQKRS